MKYLEKNLPDLQRMAVQYLPLGSAEELCEQIIAVALDRAFLAEPLPSDAAAFARRLEEGRGRLTLIAGEVARAAGAVLVELVAAQKKLKDARPPKDVTEDIAAQLERLVAQALPRSTFPGPGWPTCPAI
jgi:ATP-dependent helicase HrpA